MNLKRNYIAGDLKMNEFITKICVQVIRRLFEKLISFSWADIDFYGETFEQIIQQCLTEMLEEEGYTTVQEYKDSMEDL